MADQIADVGAAVSSGASGLLSFLFILIILGGIAAALYFTVFQKKPYKCKILVPRSSGHKLLEAPGKWLKNGKFEVSYSWSDKVEVIGPEDKNILEGNVVFGVSKSRNDIFWSSINVNELQINIEPAISPGMVVAVATKMKDTALRFTKPSFWEKVGIPGAIVLGFLIIAIVGLFGNQMIADGYTKAAAQQEKANALLANIIDHAQITIVKDESDPNTPKPVESVPGIVIPGVGKAPGG